jgi:hypothetical protein
MQTGDMEITSGSEVVTVHGAGRNGQISETVMLREAFLGRVVPRELMSLILETGVVRGSATQRHKV